MTEPSRPRSPLSETCRTVQGRSGAAAQYPPERPAQRGFPKSQVGSDGCARYRAWGMSVPREAALCGKLRWYHGNFSSSAGTFVPRRTSFFAAAAASRRKEPITMVITELLERNARLYRDEIALVEINPSRERDEAKTWRCSG